jgi:hypothetical protein
MGICFARARAHYRVEVDPEVLADLGLAAALGRTADQVDRGIGRERRRRVSDDGFAQDVERLDRVTSGSGPGPDGE